MTTISDYLSALISQKNALAENLVTQGVSASSAETLNTLVPKVLDIEGGGGGTAPSGTQITVKAQGNIAAGDTVAVYNGNSSIIASPITIPLELTSSRWVYDGEYVYYQKGSSTSGYDLYRVKYTDLTDPEFVSHSENAYINYDIANGGQNCIMDSNRYTVKNIVNGITKEGLNVGSKRCYSAKSFGVIGIPVRVKSSMTYYDMYDMRTGLLLDSEFNGPNYCIYFGSIKFKWPSSSNQRKSITYYNNDSSATLKYILDGEVLSSDIYEFPVGSIGNYYVSIIREGDTPYRYEILYANIYNDVDLTNSTFTLHRSGYYTMATSVSDNSTYNEDGSILAFSIAIANGDGSTDTYLIDTSMNIRRITTAGAIKAIYGDYIVTGNIIYTGATPLATKSRNKTAGALGYAPNAIAAGQTGTVISLFT